MDTKKEFKRAELAMKAALEAVKVQKSKRLDESSQKQKVSVTS